MLGRVAAEICFVSDVELELEVNGVLTLPLISDMSLWPKLHPNWGHVGGVHHHLFN